VIEIEIYGSREWAEAISADGIPTKIAKCNDVAARRRGGMK
jgi:hypothetical protein